MYVQPALKNFIILVIILSFAPLWPNFFAITLLRLTPGSNGVELELGSNGSEPGLKSVV